MSQGKTIMLALAGLLASAAVARAEEPNDKPRIPPTSGAAAAARAGRHHESRQQPARGVDVAKAASTGEAAAAASSAQPSPPHAHTGRDPHAVLSEPELPTAEPKPGSPAGSIAIEVVGPNGAPFPDAEIVLGVMASTSNRTEQRAGPTRSVATPSRASQWARARRTA